MLLKGEKALDEQALNDRIKNAGVISKAVSESAELLFHHHNGFQQHMNMMDGKKGEFLDRTFNDRVIQADQEYQTLQRTHKEKHVDAII